MANIISSIARSAYQIAFEISPIILVDGIAANIYGGMLPIVAITEAANFATNLLSGSLDLNPDNFFAHFEPMPGGTLVDYIYPEYPLANMQVAANAAVAQPLSLSMLMKVPVQAPGGIPAKFITFLALKTILDLHILKGGSFTILTPTFLGTGWLLKTLRDQSQGGQQRQNAWVFDFTKPLITQPDAAGAQSTLMSKISGGTPVNGVPVTQSATGGAASAPGTVLGTANLPAASLSGL